MSANELLNLMMDNFKRRAVYVACDGKVFNITEFLVGYVADDKTNTITEESPIVLLADDDDELRVKIDFANN